MVGHCHANVAALDRAKCVVGLIVRASIPEPNTNQIDKILDSRVSIRADARSHVETGVFWAALLCSGKHCLQCAAGLVHCKRPQGEGSVVVAADISGSRLGFPVPSAAMQAQLRRGRGVLRGQPERDSSERMLTVPNSVL
jgi:hypothetical protein